MKPEQLPFDLGHRAAFGREDFFVSSSNADAVAWIDKYPDWPAPFLVIYGPEGSGKTHLLEVFKQQTGGKFFDDADKNMADAKAQEDLFHFYNTLKEEGGHALLAASSAPASWPVTLPDLKSRLLAAPAVEIGSPDDQLMAVVLTKLFSDRQIFVPQEVVSFILTRAERSFAALRQIVKEIDRKALVEKRPVTVPLVKELFQKKFI